MHAGGHLCTAWASLCVSTMELVTVWRFTTAAALGCSMLSCCAARRHCLGKLLDLYVCTARHVMSLHAACDALCYAECRSMPRTLAAAVNSGWAVVGAAAEAGAVPLGDFTVDRPTVLVMGEDSGCLLRQGKAAQWPTHPERVLSLRIP